MNPFYNDIKKLVLENEDYRRVMYTTPTMQLVLMTILPGQEIGREVHHETTQFINVVDAESATCFADTDSQLFVLDNDDVIVIPPGMFHNILNTSSNKKLKLYTIYSPPEHPDGLIQHIKS